MRTFLTIWAKPRDTFDYLHKKGKNDIDFYLNTLFFLGSLAFVLPKMVGESNITDVYEFTYLILKISGTSFLLMLILKYFDVYLFWYIGKILQGQASRHEIRIVLAYSMIPNLISLFISLILIIVAIITNDVHVVAIQNPGSQLIIWLIGAHIMIIGIAKFNKFSFGYSMINIVLALTIMQGLGLTIKYLTK